MFGKFMDYFLENNKVHLRFEKCSGSIEVINSTVMNVFSPLKYAKHFSKAIENLKIEECKIVIEKTEDFLEISTEKLTARVYDDFKVDFYNDQGLLLCEDARDPRRAFIRRGNTDVPEAEGHKVEAGFVKHRIEVIKKMMGDEKFYGLGDKTGHLNKRGYCYEMWNTDDPTPHVESHKSLYKSIPFFITLRDATCFGIFFDNTLKSYFDMGKENSDYYYFGADDGNLDYYFIGGEKITEIITQYTSLTGTTPLPQMWTLGYQQSRWSYTPKSRVMEIANTFREKDIPCDVLHLDIDYMDDYKVFTWDTNKFPSPKDMILALKQTGFKIVTIIDPGVKKEHGYAIYDEGLKNGYFVTDKDGVTYVNRVWPGDSTFPDFSRSEVRDWWAENHKTLIDTGISGIWNDMNEPASFNGSLPEDVQFANEGTLTDHQEIHNVYGHLMSKATFDGVKRHSGQRPFVITRGCYAGSQKYATVWTGDNQSFWEHLRMAVPMLLNLGMSGMAFCGTDVGGFEFDCTGELLARWTQMGCFSPLFRNHSSANTRDQEPWSFSNEVTDINRKYIKLRYTLLPYLYDRMKESETTGMPVMRPLFLHYQNDKMTHEINDQFLFGENILVAPILAQGRSYRSIYLPEGKWIDYWTNEFVDGAQVILKNAPLDICPIFIKQGSIIPNYPSMSYVGEKKVSELILDCYLGDVEYIHYQDDGESYLYKDGEYNLYTFTMNTDKNLIIHIDEPHHGYSKGYTSFKFIFHCPNILSILFNGEVVCFNVCEHIVDFSVPAVKGKIEVMIGAATTNI